MLLWLAPLKIQQLQIKNDFLKKNKKKTWASFFLSVFYFHLLPTYSDFACSIVKVSHISSSLWETIMLRLCTTVLSLPKVSMSLRRTKVSTTGQQLSIVYAVSLTHYVPCNPSKLSVLPNQHLLISTNHKIQLRLMGIYIILARNWSWVVEKFQSEPDKSTC